MTLHTKLSYAKSGVRILGYIVGMIAFRDTLAAWPFWLLLLAELLGVAEEAWPGAYKGTETDDAK